MASQDKFWHEIEWEEKVYFKSTTSTNYGNPVHAKYEVDKNGKPLAQYLTEKGLEHFGVKNPEEEQRLNDESKAQDARKQSKKDGGGSSGCCSICKCIWKIFKCFC